MTPITTAEYSTDPVREFLTLRSAQVILVKKFLTTIRLMFGSATFWEYVVQIGAPGTVQFDQFTIHRDRSLVMEQLNMFLSYFVT